MFTTNTLQPRNKPIIYNGNQSVAQRGTSSTGISSGGYYTIDRWQFSMANTAGRLTSAQTADGPAGTGLVNCTKLTCTTADTSIASNEVLQFQQKLEGQDIQEFCKGTSDAKKFTVAFYVKGNASATYTCELHDRDNTRYNGQEFAVTTSWNRIVLVFNADTTGAFDDDNAVSVSLNFNLHGGSDYTGGTFSSNTWHTTANQRFGDNQTSFFDSTDRTFFITGIQMEVGEFTSSSLPPFQHESFGDNLARCQRYFRSYGGGDAYEQISVGYNSTTTQGATFLNYSSPVMRATPTLAVSANGDWKIYSVDTGYECNSNMGASDATSRNMKVFTPHAGSSTAGQGCMLQADNTTNARLTLSAEL